MRIATLKLASCSGCHVALLDTHEKVLEIAENLVFSPILIDIKDIPESDVVLVEGCVRTEEELELLREARRKTKVLIAFGTCAALGGISSLGNIYSGQQILERVYGDGQPDNVPKFLDMALPVDEYVEVDYYLPGCAPPPELIAEFLGALLKGEKPKSIEHPVCAECGREVKYMEIDGVRRFGEPEEGICLLSQGFLCQGSVTRGGCKAPCTKAGIPCRGCRGPTPKIMRSYCRDYLSEITERLMRITGFEVQAEDIASLYAHVFGSDMKNKPVSMIKAIMRSGRYG